MTIDLFAAVQVVMLAGFAGTGVAVVNQALPSGSWTRKPWSCRTCMSAWGAGVAIAAFGVPPHAAPMPGTLFLAIEGLVLWAAGAGLAHLVLGLADRGPAVSLAPDFGDDPDGRDGRDDES